MRGESVKQIKRLFVKIFNKIVEKKKNIFHGHEAKYTLAIINTGNRIQIPPLSRKNLLHVKLCAFHFIARIGR